MFWTLRRVHIVARESLKLCSTFATICAVAERDASAIHRLDVLRLIGALRGCRNWIDDLRQDGVLLGRVSAEDATLWPPVLHELVRVAAQLQTYVIAGERCFPSSHAYAIWLGADTQRQIADGGVFAETAWHDMRPLEFVCNFESYVELEQPNRLAAFNETVADKLAAAGGAAIIRLKLIQEFSEVSRSYQEMKNESDRNADPIDLAYLGVNITGERVSRCGLTCQIKGNQLLFLQSLLAAGSQGLTRATLMNQVFSDAISENNFDQVKRRVNQKIATLGIEVGSPVRGIWALREKTDQN